MIMTRLVVVAFLRFDVATFHVGETKGSLVYWCEVVFHSLTSWCKRKSNLMYPQLLYPCQLPIHHLYSSISISMPHKHKKYSQTQHKPIWSSLLNETKDNRKDWGEAGSYITLYAFASKHSNRLRAFALILCRSPPHSLCEILRGKLRECKSLIYRGYPYDKCDSIKSHRGVLFLHLRSIGLGTPAGAAATSRHAGHLLIILCNTTSTTNNNNDISYSQWCSLWWLKLTLLRPRRYVMVMFYCIPLLECIVIVFLGQHHVMSHEQRMCEVYRPLSNDIGTTL